MVEEQYRRSQLAADNLFEALLNRAFSGKLSSKVAERQVSVEVAPAKHSRGIYYKRAAIDAYIIHVLQGDKNLGRTKLEKTNHLIEYHCGVNLEREPLRDAAGPNDYASRMRIESLAARQHWYSTTKLKEQWGSRVKYSLGRNIANAVGFAERVLGRQQVAVNELLELMRPLNTKQCEIAATLYAVWNDLLLQGKSPTDDEIITDVRYNWHEKKLTIPVDRWRAGLRWLRQSRLIPRGTGKPVRHSAKS